jgi:DNA-binding MarR family transcriptional regulator
MSYFCMAQNPTPVEEMSLLFDVWLVMHPASGMLDAALFHDELSGDDFGLYSLLRVFGPVTPTRIARWTGMRPTTISANLRRMSGRGHDRVRKPG